MKCHHVSPWNESYAQTKKKSRQNNKKYWKKYCPWNRRPRMCARAYRMLEKIQTRIDIGHAVFFNYYLKKQRWQ